MCLKDINYDKYILNRSHYSSFKQWDINIYKKLHQR